MWIERVHRAIVAILAAGVVAACAGATPSPSTSARHLVADVDVENGRTIHIECQGPTDTGRPTIVFENGSGPSMATWTGVLAEITRTERACAYDRAGVGQSDAPPGERTTRDQVGDLDAALGRIGVPRPIVLVAHSRGAWNAIVYAAAYPDQVAGVVLVDADPPGLDARWLAELPLETPDEHPDIAEARMIMSDHPGDPTVTVEKINFDDATAEVLAAPGFGDRPVEILWATKSGVTEWPSGFDAELVTRLNGVYEELRGDIEALADDPNVTRVDSGHSIQEEQPEAVTQAIYWLLDRLAGV